MLYRYAIILLAVILNAAFAQLRPVDPATLASLQRQEAQRTQAALDWANANKTRWMLDGDHTFTVVRAQTDEYGYLHVRLLQRFRGLPVIGGSVVVHVGPDGTFANPTVDVRQPINISTRAQITLEQALTLGAGAFGRRTNVTLTSANTRARLAIRPEREIVTVRAPYTDSTGQSHPGEYEYRFRNTFLVWQLSANPAGVRPRDISIEAQTGRILVNTESNVYDDYTAQTGNASTLQFGNVSLSTARNETQKRFELRDITRNGNFVLNQNNSDDHAFAAQIYSNTTNNWGDGLMYTFKSTTSANGETAAADVAFGMQRVFDTLKNVFGRNGIDGSGKEAMQARVHHDVNYTDAHYNHYWKAAFFGDGKPGDASTRTQFDTLAHEFGHALFSYELDDGETPWGMESRGINEGHGDIMASLVEFYHYGANGQGSGIPDVAASWNWRGRMVNPLDPGYKWSIKDEDGKVLSTWQGFRYYDPSVSEAEEHASGCLYGHIFILLARGASADPASSLYSKYAPNGTQGIGVYDAARLWYRATTLHMPTAPTFFTVRASYLQAAEVIFGKYSFQYNAVLNAFHAGGLGAHAVDQTAPSVSISAVPNEQDGSLAVKAYSSDDTGVVNMRIHRVGATWFDGQTATLDSHLSLRNMAPGNYIAVATVRDYAGREASAQSPFVLKGTAQAVVNGDFENGATGWTGKGWDIPASPTTAYLDSRYMYSSDHASGYVTQTVSVPGNATAAKLSFRYRVDGKSDKNTLTVSVTDASKVKHVLGVYGATAVYNSPRSRNYLMVTHDMMKFAGQKLELRVEHNQPDNAATFSVDQIRLTYDAPVGLVAFSNVNLGENTVTVSAEPLGLPNSSVEKIEFFIDGKLAATDKSALFYAVLEASDFNKGKHNMKAVLTRFGVNEKIESNVSVFEIANFSNAVKNGGFEQGSAHWILSDFNTIGQNGMDVAPTAFQGQRFARFGGTGKITAQTMTQDIVIPKNSLSATLGYRLRVDSSDPSQGVSDRFRVTITDEWGNILQTFGLFNAGYDSKTDKSWRGYTRQSFEVDLNKVKPGKQVKLVIEAAEDAGKPTAFLVDNIYVNYNQLGLANTN